MRHEPGTQVYITRDCRDGEPATGQVGVYLGDYVHHVNVLWKGRWHEFLYGDFITGQIILVDGRALVDLVTHDSKVKKPDPDDREAWDAWWADTSHSVWFEVRNPLIRLPDGTYIWGCQCWWAAANEAGELPTKEEAEQGLDETFSFMQALFRMMVEG